MSKRAKPSHPVEDSCSSSLSSSSSSSSSASATAASSSSSSSAAGVICTSTSSEFDSDSVPQLLSSFDFSRLRCVLVTFHRHEYANYCWGDVRTERFSSLDAFRIRLTQSKSDPFASSPFLSSDTSGRSDDDYYCLMDSLLIQYENESYQQGHTEESMKQAKKKKKRIEKRLNPVGGIESGRERKWLKSVVKYATEMASILMVEWNTKEDKFVECNSFDRICSITLIGNSKESDEDEQVKVIHIQEDKARVEQEIKRQEDEWRQMKQDEWRNRERYW